MSVITVSFFGICTHVKVDLTSGRIHRVILPNADASTITADPVLRRQSITPHVGRLQIFDEYIETMEGLEWFQPEGDYKEGVRVWNLKGIALSIEDAVPGMPSEKRSCIPSLESYCCPGSPLQLRDGYENGLWDAEDAACVFDFPNVTPVGWYVPADCSEDRQATAAVITVGSEKRILTVTDGNDSGVITLKENVRITVSSYPDEPGSAVDKNADFLLHFLTMKEVPPRSWFPPAPPWEQCCHPVDPADLPLQKDGAGHAFTGPGCSNSAYP